MATNSTLEVTIRYLRFPLSEDHRVKVQDGSSCPRCGCRHVQKWGRFSGRQRFRCVGCRRTFSTFTATALRYLKRAELWRRFLWCHDGLLPVRASATMLGVNRDTALRWRHRLLEEWRTTAPARLRGRLVIGEFCLPHSAKGRRVVGRAPRRHGEDWSLPSMQTDPVTVLAVWASPSALIIRSLRSPIIRMADYEQLTTPALGGIDEIVGSRGPASLLARFAGIHGLTYTREVRSFFPAAIFRVRRDLRSWLRPFRGVSTRRLDNYLEWYRRTVRSAACQQFPRTARDGGVRRTWLRGRVARAGPFQLGR